MPVTIMFFAIVLFFIVLPINILEVMYVAASV